MKAAVIALGLLCAVLAYALYQRGATAKRELESLQKDHHTVSNQVAELRTRLALAQVMSSETTSNLQSIIGKRTGDLNIVSNRLVQTHLLLQASQKDARSVQEQLEARAVRIAMLEAQNEALRPKAGRPTESEIVARERDALRRELAQVAGERDVLQTQLGAGRVEMEYLQRQLFDLEFLERQLKDARVAADIRRRMASARTGAAPDPRLKLELRPDGSVRPVPVAMPPK